MEAAGRGAEYEEGDYIDTDMDPRTAARYRCLRRQRHLAPEEREAYWTAVLGPRGERAPRRGRPRPQAMALPVMRAEEVAGAHGPMSEVKKEGDQVKGSEEGEDEEEDIEEEGGDKWVEKATYPDSGMSISAQVKALFTGKAFQMSKPQLTQSDVGIVEWVSVRCKQHVSSVGTLCEYKYRFELRGGQLVELGRGAHFPHASAGALRKERAGKADTMAASKSSTSSQFRQAIAKGQKAVELPSSDQVYRRRVDLRREVRADGGSSRSELEDALKKMIRSDNGMPGTLYYDEERSDLDENVIIVLSDEMLSAAVEFAKRSMPKKVLKHSGP